MERGPMISTRATVRGPVFVAAATLAATFLASSALARSVTDVSGGPTGRIEFRTMARDRIVVWGDLALAPQGGQRQPAVVIVHGSAGPRAEREGRWAGEFNKIGYASFVLDSFGPRGVRSTGRNQAQVRGRQMIGDAFAGLRVLARHPRIDPSRIGIVGFSKGGGVAVSTSAAQYHRRFFRDGTPRFAFHIAFYPPCNFQFETIRPTGAPLLVLIGGSDDYVGVASCRRYVGRMRAAGMNASLIVYPGAHHAFDHDFGRGTFYFRQAQVFKNCSLLVTDNLRLRNPQTGQAMGSRREVWDYLRGCMTRGATLGPNPQARRKALADVRRFVLDGGRPGGGRTQ